jgi:hypothetical protein
MLYTRSRLRRTRCSGPLSAQDTRPEVYRVQSATRARRYVRKTGHVRCDGGGARAIVDGSIVEQGVAWLRNARDEACVGVEPGVEEN